MAISNTQKVVNTKGSWVVVAAAVLPRRPTNLPRLCLSADEVWNVAIRCGIEQKKEPSGEWAVCRDDLCI